MFVSCKFPEDGMRKIETRWSLSGLYVKVYILILVHGMVLSIKIFTRLFAVPCFGNTRLLIVIQIMHKGPLLFVKITVTFILFLLKISCIINK